MSQDLIARASQPLHDFATHGHPVVWIVWVAASTRMEERFADIMPRTSDQGEVKIPENIKENIILG
ncbi:hypothetical protein [Pelagibacterium sp. H642]|uniref:hypothetical protein n=1 Tax=Pelagibacterium sp. H642 TaxID=1881069 RepID=UPI0028165B53|nr:hypothetical protein [Pelagibacterium sp. H642]WMT92789.1 hypothetical protein NO934_18580 [Pelagibacterium sp. H642]